MAIGKTNAGGGSGNALNFDVKRYATEAKLLADTPKENTIGIISTTEMTGWIIDANQPENLTEGMVWISAGTSGAVKINALKKNGIQVYPLSAKQYVSGALVSVTAMTYQGGEWKKWVTYLYKAGDECTELTGGWVAQGVKINTTDGYAGAPAVTKNGDSFTLSQPAATCGVYVTKNKITVKEGQTLKVDASVVNSGGLDAWVAISAWTEIGTTVADNRVATASIGETTKTNVFELPLPAGNYYIGFSIYHNQNTLTVRDSWLE